MTSEQLGEMSCPTLLGAARMAIRGRADAADKDHSLCLSRRLGRGQACRAMRCTR